MVPRQKKNRQTLKHIKEIQVEEYQRLYEQYIQKTEKELQKIINSENGYTEVAKKVANDILLLKKNAEQKREKPAGYAPKNSSNNTILKILQMLGIFFLLVTVWPLGIYFLWKNKKFDMQFKMIETICSLVVWSVLLGWGIHALHTPIEKNHEEIVSVSLETETPESNVKQPVATKVTLIKIEAEYEGSTKAGTVLDDNNSGISVMGIYSDGTTEKLFNFEYGIKNPVTLKAGKTSTVTISYDDKEYDLKVKCTSKIKSKKKPKKKHRKGKNIIGVSNKKIYSVDAKFRANDVPNDVTGNWRICTIANNIQMVDYALNYYKLKFMDDNEIHGIVNFNYKTTTKISVLGNILDVAVYEYVSGEEHDAKILYGGKLLCEYFVYKDNGDIEKVK